MKYRTVQYENGKYIAIDPDTVIHTERDAMDVVSACYEADVSRVMLQGDSLPDEFFRLGTGLAGAVLQKFANYHVRVAVVMTDGRRIVGKFKELLAELNTGNDFRIYAVASEAEKWLMS